MDNAIVWGIIALFYAPLHFLLPVLLVLLRSEERARRPALIRTLIDCSLSMAASFALVIWLVSREQITRAMALLLCSMALPYIRILMGRQASET